MSLLAYVSLQYLELELSNCMKGVGNNSAISVKQSSTYKTDLERKKKTIVRGYFRNWRQRPAFLKKKASLSYSYVHDIFVLLLIIQIFGKNAWSRAVSKKQYPSTPYLHKEPVVQVKRHKQDQQLFKLKPSLKPSTLEHQNHVQIKTSLRLRKLQWKET